MQQKQTNPELNVKPLVEEVTRSNVSVQSIISEKLLINCMRSAVISIKLNMLSYAVLLLRGWTAKPMLYQFKLCYLISNNIYNVVS